MKVYGNLNNATCLTKYHISFSLQRTFLLIYSSHSFCKRFFALKPQQYNLLYTRVNRVLSCLITITYRLALFFFLEFLTEISSFQFFPPQIFLLSIAFYLISFSCLKRIKSSFQQLQHIFYLLTIQPFFSYFLLVIFVLFFIICLVLFLENFLLYFIFTYILAGFQPKFLPQIFALSPILTLFYL